MLWTGELDFFTLNGGLIGTVVAGRQCAGASLAFQNEAQVYRAIDGDLGEYLAGKMAAKGIYAVPRSLFRKWLPANNLLGPAYLHVEDVHGLKRRPPDVPSMSNWLALAWARLRSSSISQAVRMPENGQADAEDNPLNVADIPAEDFTKPAKYISLRPITCGPASI